MLLRHLSNFRVIGKLSTQISCFPDLQDLMIRCRVDSRLALSQWETTETPVMLFLIGWVQTQNQPWDVLCHIALISIPIPTLHQYNTLHLYLSSHFSLHHQTSNISCTLVGNKLVDHSYVVAASTASQHCSNYIFILDLTPGFNGLGKQRQMQDETRNIQVFLFGALYTRGLTVFCPCLWIFVSPKSHLCHWHSSVR